MSFNVFVNGKEYRTLRSVGSRITYLEQRVQLRPEQQEELDYLNYALSQGVYYQYPYIESFTRWLFPGYDKRKEQDLNDWGFAIRRLGKQWAVYCMVKDEIHYRVGIYKTRIEAQEVLNNRTEFLENAQKGGADKVVFVLTQPA